MKYVGDGHAQAPTCAVDIDYTPSGAVASDSPSAQHGVCHGRRSVWGAYFSDRRLAFLIPLAALFLSDLVLGFYNHMEVVYSSFALIVCIGFWLQKNRSTLHIAGAALTSSVLFFLLTNFGVWAFDSPYPRTLDGLITCYVAAIPFFTKTLQGDMLYTIILFGGFTLLEWRCSVLREPSIRSGMSLA
jgi:hypothetical protein